MAPIKWWLFVFSCCLLLCLSGTAAFASPNSSSGGSSSKKTWEKSLAWYDAYLLCLRANHSLPIPMATRPFTDLDPWVPADGSRAWVGGRYVHTGWAWTDDGCGVVRGAGCVAQAQLSPFISRQLKAHSPVDCLSVCQSAHVAMQGSDCQCLTSLPDRQVDQSHCSFRCEDNFDLSCGGLSYHSLYTWKPGPIPWDRDASKMQGECAFLFLPIMPSASAQSLRLRSSGCNPSLTGNYKPYMCQKCTSPQKPCTAIRHAAYSGWSQARQNCQNQGEQLLHPTPNQSLPLRYQAHMSESYWVGLNRDFVLKWINGLRANPTAFGRPIARQDGFCLAASRGQNSDIQLTAVNCTAQLPFLCDPAPQPDAVTFTSSPDLPLSCDPVTSSSTSRQSTTSSTTTSDSQPPTQPTSAVTSSTSDVITRTFFPETSSRKSDHSGTTAQQTTAVDYKTNTGTSTETGRTGIRIPGNNGHLSSTVSGGLSSTAVSSGSSADSSKVSGSSSRPLTSTSMPVKTSNPHFSTSAVTTAAAATTAAATATTTAQTTTAGHPLTRPDVTSSSVAPYTVSSGHVTDHVTPFPRATVLPSISDGDKPEDLTPLYITLGVLAGLFTIVGIAITAFCFCRSEKWGKMREEEGWSEDSTEGAPVASRSLNTLRTRLASRLRSEHTLSVDPLFRFVEHPTH